MPEAETLGEHIAAIVKLGAPVRAYDGRVFCFSEVGKNRAIYAMFDYQLGRSANAAAVASRNPSPQIRPATRLIASARMLVV